MIEGARRSRLRHVNLVDVDGPAGTFSTSTGLGVSQRFRPVIALPIVSSASDRNRATHWQYVGVSGKRDT